MVGEPAIANFWGRDIHLSVGAVIRNSEGEILMIDRLKTPYGFACPAGHIDEGEAPETALVREVLEETGLKVKSFKEYRINYSSDDFSDCPQEPCSRGIDFHMWFIYEVEAEGELIFKDDEVKSIGFYSIEEIKFLKLESAWEYWLKKILNNELEFI
jgi:ADP-ribose pyrophosphatase YjhB (NUDIX family)